MIKSEQFVSVAGPSPSASLYASPKYFPELDTFRALAILSVMCLHWLPAGSPINRIQDQFSNGVHLFFVLSGFLITRILMQARARAQQHQISRVFILRQFYGRRFLRIFPAYYLALAFGVLFHFTGVRAGLWWHASYLSNFYYYHRQHFDGPASLFWTLAVEEQFYLIWPLAILFLPRRMLFPLVLITAVAGTAIRVEAVLHDSWLRILLPACMNFLAVGAMVAVLEDPVPVSIVRRGRLLKVFAILIAILACASAGVTLKIGFHQAMSSAVIRAINQPMASMIYAFAFAWVVNGGRSWLRPALRIPPVVYLGKISYGLYLYHLFVTAALLRCQNHLALHLGQTHADQIVHSFTVRFSVTVLVASASWFVFERPLNNLKRYFPMQRTPHEGSHST